jgi:serine phosphatase RsbU (regulator of sigma subunit)
MTDGGFITFVCARVDRDGTVTIANAGHLPPYRNGKELELDCGLPLGVFAKAEYDETVLRLEPGEQLTFLSDGVVEARGRDGELFGFERTREISRDSA